MSDSDLIRLASETNANYLALGNERFTASGATFIRNHGTPHRYDANRVVLVRSTDSAQLAALLLRAGTEYKGFGHRGFEVNPLTPPELEASLTLSGYSVSEYLVLVLEGDLQATPKPIEVREVLSEDDWLTHRRLYEVDVREWTTNHDEQPDPLSPELMMDEFMLSKRLKAPQVRTWLAYIDGVAGAYFSSWPGDNGVGMVEDLFTHPNYRHRGLATALIARCVTDARERGAGPVIINAVPKDSPKQMYVAMGFRPLYITRSYWRNLLAT